MGVGEKIKGIASAKWNYFYMKTGEHRLILSNISNQEEVGVCVEFYFRLLSLLKVFSRTRNQSPKGDDKVGGFGANMEFGYHLSPFP